MVDSKPPPRLHVMLARDAPIGVVVRRGPSRMVCSLRWDLRTDEIQMGQWLKGRIYERRGDISPNGQFWLYMAMKAGKAYSAIAVVPFLKAKVFCSHGTTYEGGGVFTDNSSYLPCGWCDPIEEYNSGFQRSTELPKSGGSLCASSWTADTLRLSRSEWTAADAAPNRGKCLQKPLVNGWTLQKWISEHEEYRLVSERGTELDGTTWEWADWDSYGNRLVWAQEGKLYGARLKAGGLTSPTLIYDFAPLQFTSIEAPY